MPAAPRPRGWRCRRSRLRRADPAAGHAFPAPAARRSSPARAARWALGAGSAAAAVGGGQRHGVPGRRQGRPALLSGRALPDAAQPRQPDQRVPGRAVSARPVLHWTRAPCQLQRQRARRAQHVGALRRHGPVGVFRVGLYRPRDPQRHGERAIQQLHRQPVKVH